MGVVAWQRYRVSLDSGVDKDRKLASIIVLGKHGLKDRGSNAQSVTL